MGWAALGGAGLGAAKYYGVDKPQEKKQREIAAVTAQYSPWTGMKPNDVAQSSLLGDTMQGAASGAALGQNMNQADAQNAMQAKQGGLIDAQTNYYSALAKSPNGYPQPTPVQIQQQGSAGAMNARP